MLYYTQMTNMTEITESEMRMRYECANHRRMRIQHEEIFTKEMQIQTPRSNILPTIFANLENEEIR